MTALSRRRLLALAGVTAFGLTGCQVSDPRILGGPSAPPAGPAPTPTPSLPGLNAALASEAELASLSSRLRDAGPALRLSAGQLAVAGWMASAHESHVLALLGRRPTQRPTGTPTPDRGWSPRPWPTAAARLDLTNRDEALRTVLERLGRAAADHRSTALGSSGQTALLWGSMAAYAQAAGAALTSVDPRPEPPVAPVRELDTWSDMEAAQQLLSQVHAIVHGYQVAIPWLRRPEYDTAYAILVQRRDLRDRLAAMLRDRGMTVPAAEPAYGLPLQPRDRNTAAELLRGMEIAFLPFAGSWLAAATDAEDRRSALTTLTDSASYCIDWGGPLVVWPGWPA